MSKPRLIGLTGRMGSGKDAAANYLRDHHNYTKYAFADALKELCTISTGRPREDFGWTGTDWSGPKADGAREILQNTGHGARVAILPGIWSLTLRHKIEQNAPQWVVVSDVRYPNEARLIAELGGVLVKIERPGIDRSGTEHQHPTETAIDAMAADYVIVNNSGLDLLHGSMDWLVAA